VRLLALLLAAAGLAAAVASPAALANGDPPSNILITKDVYTPAVAASPASIAKLNDAVVRAQRVGYPLKVAVVKTALDLGNVPQALNRPQQYANYLLGDLHGPSSVSGDFAVLVVTPYGSGIAGKNFNGDEREAARTVDVNTSASATKLVNAATTTVEKLAAAGGHSIGGAGNSEGGGSSGVVIVAVLVGLLALTAVAILGSRARRRGHAAAGE
jgi:hypothetical protein